MCLAVVFVTVLFHTMCRGESLEELNPFMYSSNHNAVNFNDIFPYANSLVGGDAALTPEVKDEEYGLHIIPPQLVEFHTVRTEDLYHTTSSIPKYLQNVKQLRKKKEENTDEGTTETSTTDHEHTTMKVMYRHILRSSTITNKAEETTAAAITTTTTAKATTMVPTVKAAEMTTPRPHRQRGILDLLLPPKRVKTFKNVFETFRNILSYTFKR